MRKAFLVTLGLAALLATPAVADTGPFTGTVRQGQTRHHHYDNNPQHNPCPAVVVFYTVSLTYTPATDTLTLEAGGQTATGSGGSASVSFEASYCTAFTISVTGTSVAAIASYTVTVSRGGGATG
jgi:hypothetical protein